MRLVTVHVEPVELYKILKFEGLVSSGADAKAAVAEGLVKVNGEIETRKRKQISAGDIIEFGSETLRIVLDDTRQVD
jgi:ribosome-associated protein